MKAGESGELLPLWMSQAGTLSVLTIRWYCSLCSHLVIWKLDGSRKFTTFFVLHLSVTASHHVYALHVLSLCLVEGLGSTEVTTCIVQEEVVGKFVWSARWNQKVRLTWGLVSHPSSASTWLGFLWSALSHKHYCICASMSFLLLCTISPTLNPPWPGLGKITDNLYISEISLSQKQRWKAYVNLNEWCGVERYLGKLMHSAHGPTMS